MNFLIYDESGAVIQTNKVYDHANYGDVLNSHDMTHIAVESDIPLHMNDYWVSKATLTARPEMPYFMNRSAFKADGKDGIAITGLPRPCKVTVVATGGIIIVDSEECTQGIVEISSPIAATYEIKVEAWPYKTRVFRVTAQ